MAKTRIADLVLVNGFEPVTVRDIDNAAHVNREKAEALATMFRTIARLTKDLEVIGLCDHGALQADLLESDISILHERALSAGVVASGPTQAGL
jgi:hypothetical protein